MHQFTVPPELMEDTPLLLRQSHDPVRETGACISDIFQIDAGAISRLVPINFHRSFLDVLCLFCTVRIAQPSL